MKRQSRNSIQALVLDPRNPIAISDLANTLVDVRQFQAAAQTYDRLIEQVPNNVAVKVEKEFNINFLKTGNDATVLSAIAALPPSMVDDRRILTLHLNLVLDNHDWVQATRLLERLGGNEDDGFFAHTTYRCQLVVTFF